MSAGVAGIGVGLPMFTRLARGIPAVVDSALPNGINMQISWIFIQYTLHRAASPGTTSHAVCIRDPYLLRMLMRHMI